MTTKASVPKTKCPLTAKEARCGIDELTVAVKQMQSDLKKLSASMEKLWHGADLEYYATVARQLVGVPATLEKVQNLLNSVLADRTEGHEAINRLTARVEAVEARQSLHETTAHTVSTNGTMRP